MTEHGSFGENHIRRIATINSVRPDQPGQKPEIADSPSAVGPIQDPALENPRRNIVPED